MRQVCILSLCSVFFVAGVAVAQDSYEKRVQAAKRYLAVSPPEKMMADVVEKIASSMPPTQREQYQKLMRQHLDVKKIESIVEEAMIKHFTTAELNALANFYGSREGRSVMQKFGTYMADVMPAIQQEVILATQKLQQQSQQPSAPPAPQQPQSPPPSRKPGAGAGF